MPRRLAVLAAALILLLPALGNTPRALAPADDEPQFTGGGDLVRPMSYREWIFLSSGIGMSYEQGGREIGATPNQMFTNVYVTPAAYRAFMKTGHWPDKTMFVLEARKSATEGSINKGGRFQADLAGVEVEVRDMKRFPNTKGWGYYNFGAAEKAGESAKPSATSATCYACHNEHGAVDATMVQFYPTLLEVAKRLNTLDPAHKDPLAPATAR